MNPLCDYFGFLFLNYCAVPNNDVILVPETRSFLLPTGFQTEFKWQVLNYTWPSPDLYHFAITNQLYIPENNVIAGIKIYKDKMFLTMPKFRKGVPVTLGYISIKTANKLNELVRPYPGWAMNVQKDCRTLQSVQSMEIDKDGIMWVIDGMRVKNVSQCPPKLLLLDLNKGGKVIHSYTFPEEISLTIGGFLNDIVLDDTDGGYAYITDNSPVDPGLVVYSKVRNKAWKFRDKSMFGELEASGFFVDGVLVNLLAPIDGIALSPKIYSVEEDRTLYYCSLIGFNLYSIRTSILKRETMTQTGSWRRKVELVGKKESQSDGLIMDNLGNLYYTMLSGYGVGVFNIFQKTPSRILDQNFKTLVWPDTFAFDTDGYLYLVANGIHKFTNDSYPIRISEEIKFRVLKLFTGTNSYLYS